MITRRQVFAALLVGVVPTGKRWGAVTVDRHMALVEQGISLEIWLNGNNVTHRCRFFDDVLGYAELLQYKNGCPYCDPLTGEIAVETVRGFEIREWKRV
jgi:hypothetical protein